MTIISIGNINCHSSVDLFLQKRCLIFVETLSHFCRSVVSFLQIGCLIYVDRLSHFCRSVVSFLQIGCLIFVDRLSHFCRSVLIFVDQLSHIYRTVVLFLQIGQNGTTDLQKQDNRSTKMRQPIYKNDLKKQKKIWS